MDKRREKQFLIKLACVIASFALWLYVINDVNPQDERRVRDIEVKIRNIDSLIDQKLTLHPDQVEKNPTITLSIKGPVTEINRVSVEQFEAVADLRGFALKKGINGVPVTILRRPDNIMVLDRQYYVDIHLDDLITNKPVPVKVDIAVETKPGFADFEPIVRPTNVYISGPAQYVNSVEYVLAKGTAKDVDKDVEMSVPLIAVDAVKRTVSGNIINLQPQVADVVVPVKKTKTVSINLNKKGEVNKDYQIRKIEILPDKVVVAGDVKSIDEITFLETEPVDLSTITSSKTVEVKLVVPRNIQLTDSVGVVNVKFTVEKVIPKNINMDIKFNNLAQDLNYTADKTRVSFVIHGSESRINTLSLDEIQCYVDLKDLVERDTEYLLPLIVRVPEGLTISTQPPDKVKVTLTKKATATAGTGSGTSTGNSP